MPIIPVHRKLKKEDHEFKTSQGSYLKEKKKICAVSISACMKIL
jgi:hypothetical protein